MLLEKINSPEDLKKLNADQRQSLAKEIRNALLEKISNYGGHFGPNFGIVEATIALHYVFNCPKDKIVFDVSHQSYCHKMLTGRAYGFLDKERYGEISGYTDYKESEYDVFSIGHTSTSVSLACGLAKARDLKGSNENIVAVIGDGSLSGGEALEGLDFAGEYNGNLIIVVNDNNMSIAENHGGIYKNLKLLRETEGKSELNLFKAMGLDYIFVQDGNNIEDLISAFSNVKDSKRPVVVHIVTQKGKGYSLAEVNKESWHFHSPFDPETGKLKHTFNGESYNDLTALYLLDKMSKDERVVAINAGTPTVMGFSKDKREQAGKQFVDVGIAEEHAVAMASGVAKNGGKPVLGIYSTFMQRTYDQLAQDVCINSSPVTMLVYSGSIYGMNSVTHIGIYDIPLISNIPEMVYLAPTSKEEFLAMTDWAVEQNSYPVAIRVPGNGVISSDRPVKKDYSCLNKYEVTKQGCDIAILALGSFYQLGEEIINELEKHNINATLINPIYITGLDKDLLESLKNNHKIVVTLEDGSLDGGFGQKISAFYTTSDMKVLNYGYKKELLDRYNPQEVLKDNGITVEQITKDAIQLIR